MPVRYLLAAMLAGLLLMLAVGPELLQAAHAGLTQPAVDAATTTAPGNTGYHLRRLT